jgi:glycerophosphoryl diester phosphodiesterase
VSVAGKKRRSILRLLLPQLARVPASSWVLLCATHLGISAAARPAAGYLWREALRTAGLAALTDKNALALASVPGSVALLMLAGLVIAAATVLWALLVLTLAECMLSGGRGAPRETLARSLRGVRRVASVHSLPLLLAAAVLAPLAGVRVFAPASAGFGVPPFITREFFKVGITGMLWILGLLVLLLVVYRMAVTAPASLLGIRPLRPQNGRRPPADRRAAAELAAAAAAAALLPHLAAGALQTDSSGLPATSGAFPGQPVLAWSLYQLVTVVAAQAIATSLVARARLFAGRPVADHALTPVSDGRAALPRRRVLAPTAATIMIGVGALAGGATPASAGSTTPPLVIAHRGYDHGGPENTIAGLEAAAAFHPDYVEVDVQQTQDGDFVASHDVNLTLLAGRNKNIYDMSTADVVRTTVSMHGNSDTIPTMPEYVARARELKTPLLIELKVTGHEKGDPVAAMLQQLDAVDGTRGNIFHSLDQPSVEKLKRQRPELSVGLTIGLNHGELPRGSNDFYVVEQASITPAMIRSSHERGLPIYAWTVNDGIAMEALIRDGIDGIVTDRLGDAIPLRDAIASAIDMP